MDPVENAAKAAGFSDAREMFHFVASVPLSDQANIAKFVEWKKNDGTKDGLIKAFPELAEPR
jgi:hypothetical protein